MRCWPMVWATRSRSALPRSLISAELVENTTVIAGATLDGGASRVSFGAGRDDLGSGSGAVVSAGAVVGPFQGGPPPPTILAKGAGAPRPTTATGRRRAGRNPFSDGCVYP